MLTTTDSTYEEISKQMNREGYRTSKGNKWNKQMIATWVYKNRHKTAEPSKRQAAAKTNTTPTTASLTSILHNLKLSPRKKVTLIQELVCGLHTAQ